MDNRGRQLLGERLRLIREASGLSVSDLAERAQDIKADGKKVTNPRGYIYEIESGKSNPTLEALERLFQNCGSSLESALNGLWQNQRSPSDQGQHSTLDAIQRFASESGDRDLAIATNVLLLSLLERAKGLKLAHLKSRDGPRQGSKPKKDKTA